MDFEVKNQKNRKKTVPKTMFFFDCIFLSILGGFGRDFGEVLGGVWSFLDVSWGTFKVLYLRLCCQEGPRGSKRRPRALLGSIWEGFGRVLGAPGFDFGLILKGLFRIFWFRVSSPLFFWIVDAWYRRRLDFGSILKSLNRIFWFRVFSPSFFI